MMTVTAPAGAGPGTVIQVQTPAGVQMQVAVPQGVSAGMAFQVPIGAQPQVVQVNQQSAAGSTPPGGCCADCGPPKTPTDKNFASSLKVKNQIDYNPRTYTDPVFLVLYVISLIW